MIPRLAVLAMVGAWACSPSPRLAGDWSFQGDYPGRPTMTGLMHFDRTANGYTGFGTGPGHPSGVDTIPFVSVRVDRDTVRIHARPAPQVEVDFVGVLQADGTLAGSFTDDQGGAGTWSARRK